MVSPQFHKSFLAFGLILLATGLSGCRLLATRNPDVEAHLPPGERIPNEEVKTGLPPYIIEPPDVILVDAVKVIPKVPYLLEPLDIVQIIGENVFPDFPIAGNYQIEADGNVDLGSQYGSIKIAGLSTDQAEQAIIEKLSQELRDPLVTVSIFQTAGQQQISGQHAVNPEGKVNLGTYGSVYVAGMTTEQAEQAIENHLEEFLESPDVIVDISGFNSKVYYVIIESPVGERVVRLPIAGGETVLDALSQLGGIGGTSTKDIWIARPVPDKSGYMQRLPIRWNDIIRDGLTATNYQIFPNDRIFIRASTFSKIDARIAQFTAPIERISGVILLPIGAIRTLNGSFRRDRGGGFGGGFGGF